MSVQCFIVVLKSSNAMFDPEALIRIGIPVLSLEYSGNVSKFYARLRVRGDKFRGREIHRKLVEEYNFSPGVVQMIEIASVVTSDGKKKKHFNSTWRNLVWRAEF